MNFAEFLDAKFIVLCLLIVAITHVSKSLLSPLKTNIYVKTMVIPSLAITIGGIAGYFIVNITMGLIAGLLSNLVYSKVRTFIKAK